MTGESSDSIEILRNEHAQVRAIAQQIAECEDAAALPSILQQHQTMLHHHFATEEAEGGLYASIQEKSPNRQRQLELLRGQHVELLAEVDALCAGEAVDLERARALAQRLGEHEAEENHLVLDVYETDLGAGD